MKNLTVITHPLIQQNLTRLRDQATQPEEFRRALGEVAALMVYEATRTFATERVTVQTPLEKTRGVKLRREVLLVPVLRAGLGMLDPILRVIPHARVGFIGLKRNEHTLEAMTYHKSLPEDLSGFEIILMDPMLATGGSAVSALDLMAERKARRVRLVSLLAAPEGIKFVNAHYPAVPIFTAALDRKLNDKGYIVPGLGDAGDRLFGV
ncbi:MAG: uracil phosphoribosyltransferase [Verrucomicrobia bacterium]|nr:uracil phosphoribosyltransferase [Verrucomicrobiota bacterium]NBU08275.1 uracil phosphoribosyltransferase [Pseudomonadota bacterium]NDB77369.1 uracil phosphoribosyltransferase [Verrucomicrobiota bacterium]NDD39557.1 uracil phosphoribosyltransferase [Verrucomicrobiota bacterium]